MIDQTTLEILVFFSIVTGAFGRTMLKYIQIRKEAEEEDKPKFQQHYFFTMLYSLAVSLGIGLTLFPSIVPTVAPTATLTAIMVISAASGWGINDATNMLVSNVHPEDVKVKIARLKKTEGKDSVGKDAGVEIGGKTIS